MRLRAAANIGVAIMKKSTGLASIIQNISSLGVGFKLAVIVSGYIGAGSFAKWVIDVWYPATRQFWTNFLIYFDLPALNDPQKDALTALVFFLPFGVSAAVVRFNKGVSESYTRQERWLAAVLGLLFFYLVCRELIDSVVGQFAV